MHIFRGCQIGFLDIDLFIWLCQVLAVAHGIDLRSPLFRMESNPLTRGQTQAPCIGKHGVLATGPPGKTLKQAFNKRATKDPSAPGVLIVGIMFICSGEWKCIEYFLPT